MDFGKNLKTGVDSLKSICNNVDMTNRKQLLKGHEMRVESHEYLESVILYFSDCCCEEMSGEQVDFGVCPCCGELCEASFEEWTVEKT